MPKRSEAPIPREKVDAALSYLRREFLSDLSVHQSPSGSVHVRAQEGKLTYEVEFSEEFFEDHTAAEITRLLSEWNLASEMRRVEGLAVSVSSASIRLDSSN